MQVTINITTPSLTLLAGDSNAGDLDFSGLKLQTKGGDDIETKGGDDIETK